MKCEYPNCNKEAKFRLGLNDPDSEGSCYCKEHMKIRKREIRIELLSKQVTKELYKAAEEVTERDKELLYELAKH